MSDHLPKKTKCPECTKLSERLFLEATPIHYKGGGWDRPVAAPYKKGFADEVAKEFIASTKRRIATGNEHYSRFELDPKKWNEGVKNSPLEKDKDLLTPLNPEGRKAKQEKARKLTRDAYNKHSDDKNPYTPDVKNQ